VKDKLKPPINKHSCEAGMYRVENIKGSNPRKLVMTWIERENGLFKQRMKDICICPFCGEDAEGEKHE
jgi:hypothetical protein